MFTFPRQIGRRKRDIANTVAFDVVIDERDNSIFIGQQAVGRRCVFVFGFYSESYGEHENADILGLPRMYLEVGPTFIFTQRLSVEGLFQNRHDLTVSMSEGSL